MGWALLPSIDLSIRRARPVDAAALARIQVDAWRESYLDLIPGSHLAALSYTTHERHWRRRLSQQGWAYLAVVNSQIVGIASGGRCRSLEGFSGELFILYLLRAYQRRGIGRALFDTVHYELTRRGHADLVAWVLADNEPARRFYERLGGSPAAEGSCLIAGTRLREVAYGWWN